MQSHSTGPIQGSRQGGLVTAQSFPIDYSVTDAAAVKLCTIDATNEQPVMMRARIFVQNAFSAENAVAASLTTAMSGANNDLVFTAVTAGTAGNDITIAFIDPPGNNVPLSVSVGGTDIVVTLATDGSSAITSTASLVLALLNADEDASALITTTLAAANSGAGVVTAFAETALAGGTAAESAVLDLGTTAPYIDIVDDASLAAAGTSGNAAVFAYYAKTDVYARVTFAGDDPTVGKAYVVLELSDLNNNAIGD